MIPLANHLWQSTVFALCAGLLALALRQNQARTRHWIWLTASLKFLIPFSLLVALGSRLEWPVARAVTKPEMTVVLEQVSEPFLTAVRSAPVAPLRRRESPFPGLALAVWAGGFLVISLRWWLRWRGIRAAVRTASLLAHVEGVSVLCSATLLEPGVFGIFGPVLLLPQGITDHLTAAQLQAILAHELCHVRRRDNLAAALHMMVEAIFWFHPLVWWVGARLVEERERACDEEVLRLGNAPKIYAESILKTCQFYLESPLACISGISGSDLKTRIAGIMSQRMEKKLSFSRKLLLAVSGTAALAVPVLFGMLNAQPGQGQSTPDSAAQKPKFEVASIKPNKSGDGRFMLMNRPGGRFSAENVTVKMLIEFAYQLKSGQLTGATGWMNSETYDLDAKAEAPAPGGRDLSPEEDMEQRRQMVQALLADRFKLSLQRETKELPVYVLTIAKNGPKLKESKEAPQDPAAAADPPGPPPPAGSPGPMRRRSGLMFGRGEFTLTEAPMNLLADMLSRQLGRIVIDKTGLTGKYDATLKWTPDENQGQMMQGTDTRKDTAAPSESSGPSIFTAVQEQLGLKLDSQKAPVDTFVIEHVERPSAN